MFNSHLGATDHRAARVDDVSVKNSRAKFLAVSERKRGGDNQNCNRSDEVFF